MISENIRSIGFELECGINKKDLSHLKEWVIRNGVENRFDSGGDGSVCVSDKELNSCEIRFWSDNIKTLKDFLQECYTVSNITVNSTCGFHIHVKFKNHLESIFSYNKFYKRFIDLYKEHFGGNGKYMERLNNHFCHAHYSEKIIRYQLETKEKGGCRYNAINLNSINLYNTLEFRIFPQQENFEEATGTLSWLTHTIEQMISENKNRKIKYVSVDLRGCMTTDNIEETREVEILKCE